MCIIAVIPKGKVISKHTIYNMFENNPDGAGIGYLDKNNNKLTISKGIFSPKELYERYKYVKENSKSDIIIHCRIATHGKINADMCHPFFVNEHLLVAHNGIIPGIISTDTKSDTHYFVRYVLGRFKEGFEYDAILIKYLEYSLGHFNKLAFLNNKGVLVITNKKEWIMHKGILYSNESFLDYNEYIDNGRVVRYETNKDWSDDYEEYGEGIGYY